MNTTKPTSADLNRISLDIRRESNGQFGHGLDCLCRCGRTKGEHLAHRPWDQDDTSDGLPACLGFKKARNFTPVTR